MPAVAVTGLGMSMSALDSALFIMCAVHSLSWLLVVGQAWGGRTYRPGAGCLPMMGVKGVL